MSRNTKSEHRRQQFAAKREKCIFEFFDGAKDRKVDVWNALIQIQQSIPLEVAQAASMTGGDTAKLIATFRTALTIPVWTEENDAGLTDGEVIELIQEFMAFVEAEKKSTKPSPTLPESTAQAS